MLCSCDCSCRNNDNTSVQPCHPRPRRLWNNHHTWNSASLACVKRYYLQHNIAALCKAILPATWKNISCIIKKHIFSYLGLLTLFDTAVVFYRFIWGQISKYWHNFTVYLLSHMPEVLPNKQSSKISPSISIYQPFVCFLTDFPLQCIGL